MIILILNTNKHKYIYKGLSTYLYTDIYLTGRCYQTELKSYASFQFNICI